jgi:hypothetical protein
MATCGVEGAHDVWMHREPFEDWLAQHTTKGGHDGEPGTILVWRSVDGAVQHAAVTLGDGWALHKPSQGWMSPTKVLALREMKYSARARGQRLHRRHLGDRIISRPQLLAPIGLLCKPVCMTSDAVPAGGDPRRLLAEARDLARRVRLAQRVTWLPLLVLALVTFGAIPVHRYGRMVVSNCHAVDGGQVCKAWEPAAQSYWLATMVLAYVVIAGGYLRVARARGVDARVLPYVLTGVALSAVMFAAIAAGAGAWIVPDPQELLDPSTSVQVLFRLLAPTGAIGLALLVLAWLERHVALLLFTLAYLAVVLVPINFGWGVHWGQWWGGTPPLVISGGVLLLGCAGFALAQWLRRPR